jgi:translation initiation factor 1
MTKNKKNIVYSTNPNYSYQFEEENELETLPPDQQTLAVHFENKHRGGKSAVIVKGFVGKKEDLESLGKLLKTKCGVGGSVKDGEVIVQGEMREKVISILDGLGYKTKRVGG